MVFPSSGRWMVWLLVLSQGEPLLLWHEAGHRWFLWLVWFLPSKLPLTMLEQLEIPLGGKLWQRKVVLFAPYIFYLFFPLLRSLILLNHLSVSLSLFFTKQRNTFCYISRYSVYGATVVWQFNSCMIFFSFLFPFWCVNN